MKIDRWHLSITLVCLLFGVLFVSNLKTQLNQENSPLAVKNKTLVEVIKTQESKNHELESEIAKIRDSIEKLHQTKMDKAGEPSPSQDELENLKVRAGLTKLHGPGITISLNDQEKARTEKDPEFFIIHYNNLLYVINDLRAGGAEAISINGDRIVGSTDIRCAGSIILVNTHRMAPPYVIQAIGNPEKLEAAARQGEYTTLEQSEFPVTLKKNDDITINEYTGSFTFNYAAPQKEGAK